MKKFHNTNFFSFKNLVIFLFICYFLLFFVNVEFLVRSDGWYYFHSAKCLVNEGSFVCANRPIYWDYMDLHTKTIFNGKYVSVTSVGNSLVYLPALVFSSTISNFIDLNNEYFIALHGHTLLDGIAIALTALILNILSLLFIYKSLRILGFNKFVSLLSIVVIVISTYLLWYVFILHIFTHMAEVFFTSLLLYAYLKYINNYKNRFLFLVVFAIGFLFLIRPILLPIGIVFALAVLFNIYKRFKSSKILLKSIVFMLFSIFPFVLLYFFYNYVSYGSILTSGYAITRGETFTNNFNAHNLVFSPYRGWVTYSPIILFSFFGFYLFYRNKEKILSLILFIPILIIVVIYGFWPAWWGGGSFGSRFMLFAVPFLALGLSKSLVFLYENIKVKKIQIFIFFVVFIFLTYSLSLMFLYRITPISTDFYTPLFFYEYHINLANNSKNVFDFIEKEIYNLQAGSTIPIYIARKFKHVLKVTEYENSLNFELFYSPVNRQMNILQSDPFNLYLVPKNKTDYLYSILFSQGDVSLFNKAKIFFDCTQLKCVFTGNENLVQEIQHLLLTEIDKSKFDVQEYEGYETDSFYLIFRKNKLIKHRSTNPLYWDPVDRFYSVL